jgi:hypothetical protein
MDIVRNLAFDDRVVSTKLSGTFDGKYFFSLALETYSLPNQEKIKAYLWDFDEVNFPHWSKEEMEELIQKRGEIRTDMEDMKPAIYIAAKDDTFGILRMQQLADPMAGKKYPIYVFRTLEEATPRIEEILKE